MNSSAPVASDDYANLQLQQDSEMHFENDSQDDHYTKYLQYMKDTYNIDLNVNEDAESEPILSASPAYDSSNQYTQQN
jgi:hypothetical protein